MKKIHVKPKKLSLGPKYPLFGYIKARICKIIATFEISTLEFFIFQSCVQTKKFLNLGPKMSFSAVWSIIFEKPLSYLKSAPSTLSNCKILCKNKYAGIKNTLFGHFWAGNLKIYSHGLKSLHLEPNLPYLGVLDTSFENLLSYLKSVCSTFSYWNVWYKKKVC